MLSQQMLRSDQADAGPSDLLRCLGHGCRRYSGVRRALGIGQVGWLS